MATTKRDDVFASDSAESAEAQQRGPLSPLESADRPMSQTELDARENAIRPARRQAGPELVDPDAGDALGQDPLRRGAPDTPPTDLEDNQQTDLENDQD